MERALSNLLEAARKGADGLAEDAKAGDDWFPMLLLESDDTLTVIALPSELFANDMTKDALAYSVFPYLSNKVGAQAMCLLSSTWIRRVERGQDPDEVEPGEALVLAAVSKTQTVMQVGTIVRDAEGVPGLEWQEPTVSTEETEITGRFTDAMLAALDPDPSQWEGFELDLEQL